MPLARTKTRKEGPPRRKDSPVLLSLRRPEQPLPPTPLKVLLPDTGA